MGEYLITGSGENTGKEIAGRFGAVYVREGNDWHLAMLTGNGGLKQRAAALLCLFSPPASTRQVCSAGAGIAKRERKLLA